MKILFDAKGFDAPYSGVAYYLIQLLKHFDCDQQWKLAVAETNNPELMKPPFNLAKTGFDFKRVGKRFNFKWKGALYRWVIRLFPGFIPAMEMRNEKLFRKLLKEGDYDVLHLSGAHYYGTAWKSVLGKKPIVVTIHDLMPEILDHNMDVASQRREILSAASQIIAVSEKTKRDVIDFYGTPADKISVVYHGCTQWPQSLGESPFPDRKYILYVGTRMGAKNFDFFIRAVSSYLKVHPELTLICTGKDFTEKERELMSSLGILDRCMAQFMPDDRMHALYANAGAFVFPSKYEGFGIPVIDALNAGCPTVLSNCSCFPEIGGDAALYFEEDNADDLRKCLDEAIYDMDVRQHLIQRGLERARTFDWHLAAQKTSEVYKRAVRAMESLK